MQSRNWFRRNNRFPLFAEKLRGVTNVFSYSRVFGKKYKIYLQMVTLFLWLTPPLVVLFDIVPFVFFHLKDIFILLVNFSNVLVPNLHVSYMSITPMKIAKLWILTFEWNYVAWKVPQNIKNVLLIWWNKESRLPINSCNSSYIRLLLLSVN